MNLNSLILSFTTQFENVSVLETDERLVVEYILADFAQANGQLLEQILISVPDRDTLTLDITIGQLEPDSISNKGLKCNEFLEEIRKKLSRKDADEKIKAKVTINKTIISNTLSVYVISGFSTYVKGLNPALLLDLFNSKIGREHFNFQLFDSDDHIHTSSFSFYNGIDTDLLPLSETVRTSRCNGMLNACHYSESSRYTFLPEDFLVISYSGLAELKFIIDCLCTMHGLIFLVDISSIERESIYFKLNGYKSITCDLRLDKMPVESQQHYLKIYSWIYQDGNLFDKLGLARNIISLHLTGVTNLILDEGTFESILSAHKIYLENNIKQYLEIRNKISDQLLEFNKKAGSIVDSYAGNFQKSIFAFLTFLISMIFLRLANKDGEISISGSAAILCVTIFICIAVFLVFSLWELNSQKSRFEISYANLKLRFKDLLDEKDIARILRNDSEYNSDLQFIKGKRNYYTAMWIIVMLLFSVALFLLYFKGWFIEMANLLSYLLHGCKC